MKDYSYLLKWVGALLGLLWGKSIVLAIFGYFLGALIGGMFRFGGRAKVFKQTVEDSRNSFLRSLMVLSAHIIQADGRIMHSEMEAMRRFLLANFGEETMRQGNQFILDLFQRKKSMTDHEWQQYIRQSAMQMAMIMTPQQRLQLLSYLMEVANADSGMSPEEIKALKEVAVMLQLDATVIDQMMGLGGDSLEDAYRVLGVSPQDTDEAVRKAYKRMALDNHPDRVASLGEDVRRAAEKKFKDINDAKERIFKARGMR
ncbi:MAG: TerB family tellurite resistance protein [Bacteroidaceae bacterium]|nr:TerB family tellurite resistance protein [Bacteroidaceae bacterium]